MVGPAGSPRAKAHPAIDPRSDRWSQALIAVTYAWTVLPSAVGKFFGAQSAPDGLAASNYVVPAAQRLAATVLQVMVLVLSLWIIYRNREQLPKRPDMRIVAIFAPWIYVALQPLMRSWSPPTALVIYPTVVFAIWALRTPIESLRILGVLTAGLASICVVVAVLYPRAVLMISGGIFMQPQKQTVGLSGMLEGPFNHANTMGVFMAVGGPAILLFRRRARIFAFIPIAIALAWTGSRTSSFAFVAALTVAWVLPRIPRRLRKTAGLTTIAVATGAALVIPFVTTTKSAFTGRGEVWYYGIMYWRRSPFVGQGMNWFFEPRLDGFWRNDRFSQAHNFGVQALVTGGIVFFALGMFFIVTLARQAARQAVAGQLYPVAFAVALMLASVLESPFAFGDRWQYFGIVTVPAAIAILANPARRSRDSRRLPRNRIRQSGQSSLVSVRHRYDPKPVAAVRGGLASDWSGPAA